MHVCICMCVFLYKSLPLISTPPTSCVYVCLESAKTHASWHLCEAFPGWINSGRRERHIPQFHPQLTIATKMSLDGSTVVDRPGVSTRLTFWHDIVFCKFDTQELPVVLGIKNVPLDSCIWPMGPLWQEQSQTIILQAPNLSLLLP